jgi:transcriptional regulator with XRE-family HTH domain
MQQQNASPLGLFIREKRKAMGLSIREFASRIDRSPTFLVLLETEPTPPSTTEALLAGLARELDTSEDFLFGLVRKMPETALPSSADEVALYRRVKMMSDADKLALLNELSRKQSEQ